MRDRDTPTPPTAPHPGTPGTPRRPSARDLLVAFHADPGTGPAPACRLAGGLEVWRGWLRRAPGPAAVREAAHGLGMPGRDLQAAVDLIPRAAELAGEEERRAADAGGRLVTRFDPGYPRPLLDLPLPPPVLAVAGEIPAGIVESGLAVAMVGSRRADAYGLEVAADFARALAAAGLPVVSGFARGVDTAAHRGAVDAGGGTVAVLGCGLDVDYPRGHRTLFRRIAEGGGAVVSEFPCGAGPRRWHFPVRNRIIAALALGTLVVRAAARSGSLITARHALDLGREVLAVPGPVFDRLSAGPNRLLEDGAAVAWSPRAVLEALVGPSGALGLLQRAAERRGAAGGDGAEAGATEAGDGAGGAADGAGNSSGGTGDGAGSRGAETGGAEIGDGSPGERTDGGLASVGRPSRGLPARVLAALPVGRERSPEAVAEELEAGVDTVLGALLELELGGWVRRMPGPAYARRAGG